VRFKPSIGSQEFFLPRNTRQHFGLKSAGGVLFILNDRISILSPNVLAARLEQQMHKHGKRRRPLP
jgi:hypothetical protein